MKNNKLKNKEFAKIEFLVTSREKDDFKSLCKKKALCMASVLRIEFQEKLKKLKNND